MNSLGDDEPYLVLMERGSMDIVRIAMETRMQFDYVPIGKVCNFRVALFVTL